MLIILTLDHIENVFLCFVMYSHGKLDLKFVHGRTETGWKRQDFLKQVYASEAEIAEKKVKPRVLEKKVCLVADTFTLISNCYYN